MRRGEVRWYTFRSRDKRRPVLVLTRDSAIGFLTGITVAPITTTVWRMQEVGHAIGFALGIDWVWDADATDLH